jgi:hypothetical protein
MSNKTYACVRFNQSHALTRFFPHRHDGASLASDRQANLGICFALSLHWLKRIASFANEGARERIEFIGSEASIVHCVQAQLYYMLPYHVGERKFLSKFHGRDRHLETAKVFGFSKYARLFSSYGYDDEISRSGISFPYLRFLLASNTIRERARAVTSCISAPSTSHVLSISHKTNNDYNVGHALACSMSRGVLFFFDPNIGEIHVPESDVHDFLINTLTSFDRQIQLASVEVARLS